MKYRIRDDKRIVAIKDFGQICEGTVGGFVDSERNLSQEGNCWVYDDAQVKDHAFVEDSAMIRYNAIVQDFAHITGRSMLTDNAKAMGRATVHDSSLFDDTIVMDQASLNDACLTQNAIARDLCYVNGARLVAGIWSISPLIIYDKRHHVSVAGPNHVRIGCEIMTIEEWLEIGPEMAVNVEYTEEEIMMYARHLETCKLWLETFYKEDN